MNLYEECPSWSIFGESDRRNFLTAFVGAGATLLTGCGGGGQSGAPGIDNVARFIAPRSSSLVPSNAWTGIAGSGFTSPPVDPVRKTAKPVLRALIPPFQWFTSGQIVGVFAAANHSGSLFENLGLEKVIIHYEGTKQDIHAPGFASFTDANGEVVSYFGWWAKLRNDGRYGHAHVYFEAVPKDASMQKRVIGPFQFSPQAVVYDEELTIAPSQPEIEGRRYRSFQAALTYLRDSTARNPRIVITEAGSYPMRGHDFYPIMKMDGYVTVEATEPVIFTGENGTLTTDFNPKCNMLHLKGQNITLDWASCRNELYRYLSGETLSRDYWLDGCKLKNSNGKYDLRDGSARNMIGWIIRGNPWITECTFENLWNAAVSANLLRGSRFLNCWGDAWNYARMVIGCEIQNFGSSQYRSEIDAVEISYAGPEQAASISISGSNSTNKRNVILKYGLNSAVFVISTDNPNGGSYWVNDLADWIDSIPGFSATVLDNSRRAAALTVKGAAGLGGFDDVDISHAPLILVAAFDVHSDIYQIGTTGSVFENWAVVSNRGWNINSTQLVFLQGPGGVSDVAIFNNAFHVPDGNVVASQIQHPTSHFIFAHNSFSGQGLLLRREAYTKFQDDKYSLIANNALRTLGWIGEPQLQGELTDNHLAGGAVSPYFATGTTVGGSTASLFANAANGNFAPQGDLALNVKKARLLRDLNYGIRRTISPAGAVL